MTHRAALCIESSSSTGGDFILKCLDKGRAEKMEQNRKCLANSIGCLQFLARQGLAAQGNTDQDGNFEQLLKLRSKDCENLKEWLQKDQNKYTSHDCQNEILILMANELLRGLVREIKGSYFSLICDEYTEISNKEQMTLCLRWVDPCMKVSEDFMGFYELKDIGAETISSAILDCLTRLNIQLDKCRGQCFDGASNMMGKKQELGSEYWKSNLKH